MLKGEDRFMLTKTDTLVIQLVAASKTGGHKIGRDVASATKVGK